MKNTLLKIAILFTAFTSAAFAADGEFSADGLVKATQASLKVFGEANASHVAHISGFKTWKTGADAKVKIYVAHDGMSMEYNYQCQDQAGEVHCTAL